MSPGLRKILLVLVALLVAGAITYWPWTYRHGLRGAEEYAYYLTVIYWAPAALVVGLVTGFGLALALWPRKPKPQPPPGEERPKPGPSAIDA